MKVLVPWWDTFFKAWKNQSHKESEGLRRGHVRAYPLYKAKNYLPGDHVPQEGLGDTVHQVEKIIHA